MAEPLSFGDYRLLRRIGAGGMAEVYLAKRLGARGFEKQLVIKRMLPHLSSSEHSTNLFLREARYAALIDHPNLVHVSDFGELNGRLYLAMEFVHGTTVSELLKLLGSLSPAVACRVAMEVCAALHAIHTALDEDGQPLHLVHRDITPRNVMVTGDGGVKLLDFGIALPRDLAASSAMGTKRYMSPEHVAGQPQDHRSDIFALGVLIYEMIAGRPPFALRPEGVPPRPDAMPEALYETVRSMLALEPESRPSSARAVQSVLELFVGAQGLEGTRAHLGEIVTSILPAPSALKRLTNNTVTRILRLTNSMDAAVATDGPARPGWASLAAAARIIGPLALFLLLVVAGLLILQTLREEAIVVPTRVLDAGPIAEEPPLLPQTGEVAIAAPEPEADAGARDAAEEPAPAVLEPEPRDAGEEPARPKKRTSSPGSLTIDTRPWSEVYLDGRKLGMTPLEGERIPSGKHELELRHPELGVRRVRVTIRPGRTTRVRFTF